MNKLKREGFVNGVAELFLMIPNSQYHGLFIGMKRAEGGTVSKKQHQFIENANERGYQAIVCKGFEHAKNTILEYMRG